MKSTITIVALVVLGAAAVYAYSRFKRQRALDEVYSDLRALPPVARDFTTPEGAILCLEDAYRRRDIEGAIAAKDFKTEARVMLEKKGLKDKIDDEMIAKTAEALLLSFRAHTTANWPDFEGLESYFTKREPYCDKVVVVTEVSRYPDREFSRQNLLVAETSSGWRVLNPVSN